MGHLFMVYCKKYDLWPHWSRKGRYAKVQIKVLTNAD